MARTRKKLFNQKFDQTFFNSYGFENTFAFMVTKETAKKFNLHTVSDLEKVKDIETPKKYSRYTLDNTNWTYSGTSENADNNQNNSQEKTILND